LCASLLIAVWVPEKTGRNKIWTNIRHNYSYNDSNQ
jgi:hypothetical protein